MKKRDDGKVKSWVLLLAGLGGMAWQQYTGEVNWMLLLVFTVMVGIPIPVHLLSLIKNSSTISQLSTYQQELLQQDLENSSQKGSTDDKT